MEHDQNKMADEWIPHRCNALLEWAEGMPASSAQCLTASTPDTPRHRYRQKVLSLDPRVLLSWLRKFTRESLALEDLLQEVYERLLRVDDSRAETIRSVPQYAFGITRHVAYDWRQRRQRSPIEYVASPEGLTAADPRKDVETIVAGEQQINLLLEEICRLPARCRKVLILIKVFGHSAKEAAEHMGIAESTVKKQLQLAAARCEEALERRARRPGLLLLSRLLGR